MNHPNLELMPRERLTCRADVSLQALTYNLRFFQSIGQEAEIVAMVKANAYGHGAAMVAQHLERQGVKWFGVATLEEGMELREHGVGARILVMSGSGAHLYPQELVESNLTPLLSSLDELEAIRSELASNSAFRVHLDIDTGMTRGGFFTLPAQATLERSLRGLCVEGVATHFAKAESEGCEYSDTQVERFCDAYQKILAAGQSPTFIHLDKSASLLTREHLKLRNVQTLVRPGIGLYGVDPTTSRKFKDRLKPALTWRAPIVLRKSVPAGTAVGYDCTFVTKAQAELALVRVGYADGLDRQLSNTGSFLCAGMKAPIVGRISMDLSVIEVTDIVRKSGEASCSVGTMVTIIGEDGSNAQGVDDIATTCHTIPYEILTSISSRVKRFAI